MTRPSLRCAAALLALALAGCGRETAGGEAAPAGTSPTSIAEPATSPSSTVPPATSPALATTTRPAPAPTAPPTSTSITAVLGPEWTQRDGRVLIEATASGDPRTLLRELEELGLRDGVVFGRVVNGWLPVESFPAAQRLGSLQFVRPTGAGTG